jgi:hypothetical protein
MSTLPDLEAAVLRVMGECPGEPLVVDLRRIWFCDLAGLRGLWWLTEHGEQTGTQLELRGSVSIARVGQLVEHLRAARIA